ncbi:MAG: DUF815 domain-containing protein [Hyphomicrobiales bacterium]|nr:MAG: DUF815 domain-containing protein [Hyphomicrobiales bacterium]
MTDPKHAAWLQDFEAQYIPFPPFVAAKDAITSNLKLFREVGLARNMLVLGESGTGKSTLCKWLLDEYPPHELADRTKVDVLFATVPPASTIGGLAGVLLQAVGDPTPFQGTVANMTARLVALCHQCGVEMIMLDEAQHLQDRGTTKTHYLVGDWLKTLIDQVRVPTVMLGLPRLELLLQTNEQMRRRFSRRIHLVMGQSDEYSVDFECLQLFLSLASLIQLPVSAYPYSSQEMGERLYYACDGRVAYIKKLLFAALRRALETGREAIEVDLLEQAFIEEVWWEGTGKRNPFDPSFTFRRLDSGGEPFQGSSPLSRRAAA